MRLQILPQELGVCRLDADQPVPDWVWLDCTFCSVTYTRDELSLVCPVGQIPEGITCERGWAALKVVGPLDFSLTGILASLTVPLAEAGIPIFTVSTFDTDYLLLKTSALELARKKLEQVCHQFIN